MIAWLYFMSSLISILILLYFLKKVVLLHYVTLWYRYQRTCDLIPSNAPSQDGHWNAIILHTARVFIAPIPGVPFKIPVTQMIRLAIIEYAQYK